MGGLDVIQLRGICDAYGERHFMPLVRELRSLQGEILEKLKALEDAKLVEQRCAELQDRVAMKADLDMVPSLAQFEELGAKLEQLSKGGDTEARLQIRLGELEAALRQKADPKDVASSARVAELEDLVSTKADLRDVVSSEQMKRLTANVERKAFVNKVPTLQQYHELEKAVANKVDSHLCPTIHEVRELAEEVKRKKVSTLVQEEMRRVSAELHQKANASDILTPSQVEHVVQQKVDVLMARKADTAEVPSLSQHKELAAATERKLSFLATKVNKKSDAIREMRQQQQQPQTVWCVHPAMVDMSWDENGQAWPEWNPSQVTLCSGANANNYEGNIFVPSQTFVGSPPSQSQCMLQPTMESGCSGCGPTPTKDASDSQRANSGSTSAASSTAPQPSQDAPHAA